MSPSWNGWCSGSFASRNARAFAGSPYPRLTSTLAVSGLSPSSLARASTSACGAEPRSVQGSFDTGSPRYGGRRTAPGLRSGRKSRGSPRRIRLPGRPVVGPPAPAGVELPRDAAGQGPRLRDLFRCEAALADPFLHDVVVFQLPAALGRDPDVELEVLRVVADRRAAEGLLQVDVPAVELPRRAGPEDPDRIGLARTLQHEDAVPQPPLFPVPRMTAIRTRPVAGGEAERSALGDIGRQQPRLVDDHDQRHLQPGPAVVQDLSADDHLARGPGHSRGSLMPSNESATSTASAATVSATTRHGCSRRRNDSQPIFVQSTARPATAPATTTSTGASTAARSSLMSKSQTTSSTRPATTRPERSEARIRGYSPFVEVENYSSGDDIVVEFLRLRFSFNTSDFAQRVSAAAYRLGLVDDNELDDEETDDLVELTADGIIEEPRSELGRYLVRHWERLSLVDGESLVYWLRKLVFRGAWLDHRVKDGRLDGAWDDGASDFTYLEPGGTRALLELAPTPSWHELQFRR